jgi:hypothetical protein
VPNGTLVAHGPEACCDCAPIRAITATSHFFQVSFEHTHLFLPSSLFLGRMITKLASNHRLHYHATTISHVIVFNLERHTHILGGRNIGLGSISIIIFPILYRLNSNHSSLKLFYSSYFIYSPCTTTDATLCSRTSPARYAPGIETPGVWATSGTRLVGAARSPYHVFARIPAGGCSTV